MRKLTNNEMKKVTGGNAHLPMNSKYRNKNNCLGEAQNLISRGMVARMTQDQIAREIFAHAVAYYAAPTLGNIPGIGQDIKDYLISHAETIDIMDGGDTAVRQAAYNVIWAFTGDSI